jgi:plasmid stabilization system protein ParE
MKYEVVLSDRAARELAEATAWYVRRSQSEEIGQRWHEGFVELIAGLCASPDRHMLAPESDRFPVNLREVHYGSGRRKTHRAVFSITGRRVDVVTIRHFSQRDLTPDDL